ncbi:Serine/threonine-protein kinase phg2 [Tetrabaena socialis]|uniref:Serine/threonine-protein kinase phg2 n=1 Tax=Tetrabaena socialis TaxID=47790 RepID=A0A2J7ZMZ2_9CHLO|nr:Serine/threonine-protein kinase phg2 [Tetrabaena socialis]|eukprot:PNH01627.1 Serine/threonine-protein kinase phg2 [Tetrabaena socialis]
MRMSCSGSWLLRLFEDAVHVGDALRASASLVIYSDQGSGWVVGRSAAPTMDSPTCALLYRLLESTPCTAPAGLVAVVQRPSSPEPSGRTAQLLRSHARAQGAAAMPPSPRGVLTGEQTGSGDAAAISSYMSTSDGVVFLAGAAASAAIVNVLPASQPIRLRAGEVLAVPVYHGGQRLAAALLLGWGGACTCGAAAAAAAPRHTPLPSALIEPVQRRPESLRRPAQQQQQHGRGPGPACGCGGCGGDGGGGGAQLLSPGDVSELRRLAQFVGHGLLSDSAHARFLSQLLFGAFRAALGDAPDGSSGANPRGRPAADWRALAEQLQAPGGARLAASASAAATFAGASITPTGSGGGGARPASPAPGGGSGVGARRPGVSGVASGLVPVAEHSGSGNAPGGGGGGRLLAGLPGTGPVAAAPPPDPAATEGDVDAAGFAGSVSLPLALGARATPPPARAAAAGARRQNSLVSAADALRRRLLGTVAAPQQPAAASPPPPRLRKSLTSKLGGSAATSGSCADAAPASSGGSGAGPSAFGGGTFPTGAAAARPRPRTDPVLPDRPSRTSGEAGGSSGPAARWRAGQVYGCFSDAVVIKCFYSGTTPAMGAQQLRLCAADDPMLADRDPSQISLNEVLALEFCDAGTLLSAAWVGAFRAGFTAGAGEGAIWPALVPLYTSLLEVVLALRYLHSRGLVHGDIKPQNVLLRSSARDPRGWVCKLSDFGWCAGPGARLLGEPDVEGRRGFQMASPLGTVTHMSPECFINGAVLGAEVDIYAFGIMMWELLMCRKPYHGVKIEDLPKHVVRSRLRPIFHPLAPQPYRTLAERCFAQNPRRRPTASDLVSELQALLAEAQAEPVTTTAVAPPPPPYGKAAGAARQSPPPGSPGPPAAAPPAPAEHLPQRQQPQMQLQHSPLSLTPRNAAALGGLDGGSAAVAVPVMAAAPGLPDAGGAGGFLPQPGVQVPSPALGLVPAAAASGGGRPQEEQPAAPPAVRVAHAAPAMAGEPGTAGGAAAPRAEG